MRINLTMFLSPPSYSEVVQSILAFITLIGGGLLLLNRSDLTEALVGLMGVVFGYYFRDFTGSVVHSIQEVVNKDNQ